MKAFIVAKTERLYVRRVMQMSQNWVVSVTILSDWVVVQQAS